MEVELPQTTFDTDLDGCDTGLPWLKSLPALIPIPRPESAVLNTSKETSILTIQEVNEDLQQLLLLFEESNKSDLQQDVKHDQDTNNEDESENRLLIVEPEIRKYTCTICQKEFRKPEYLSLHQRTHTGEKPYACDICPKRYRQKSHLNKHKIKHFKTEGKKHVCQICFKAFALLEGLKHHQTLHSSEKPFECSHCPLKFKQKHHFDRHQRSCHSDEEKKGVTTKNPKTQVAKLDNSRFPCSFCPTKFKHRTSLRRHIKQFHTSGPYVTNPKYKSILKTSYQTPRPPKKTPNKSIITACQICGLECKTRYHLRNHLADNHYRERIKFDLAKFLPNLGNYDFSCPLCEYVGNNQQNIYSHYIVKHKVVEQYLAQDIKAGLVKPFEVASKNVTAKPLVSNLNAESTKTMPKFDNDISSGLDLSVNGLQHWASNQFGWFGWSEKNEGEYLQWSKK